LAQHRPQHPRRIGAERHAHGQLALPAPDQIGQHAEDADRGDARRQAAEDRKQRRQQSRPLQDAVECGLHGLHPGQRQLRIDSMDRLTQAREHRHRAHWRADQDRETAALEILDRNIDRGTRLLPQPGVAHIADDTNDFEVLGVASAAEAQPLADGIGVRPVLLGKRPIDDDFVTSGRRVRAEVAAAHERNSQRLEISRRHDERAELRVDRDIGPVGQGKAVALAGLAKRKCFRAGCRYDAGQRSYALENRTAFAVAHAGAVIAAAEELDVEAEDVGSLHARIDRREPVQTHEREQRGIQQHADQADLEHDQACPQLAAARAVVTTSGSQ